MADKGSTPYKVVVLGDKGVGKTSLVIRFIEGVYTSKQQSTIGAFFLSKNVKLADGSTFKMQLWDTAGQERFRSMAPMYYRGAASAIVCFDITNEDSFSKMKDWVEELKQNLPPDSFVLVIACNKVDLEDQRVVSKTRIVEFAKKCNALTFETSAKDNIGIDDLFKRISEEMVARKRVMEGVTSTNRDGSLKINENNNSGKLAKTKSNSSCC